MPEDVNDAFNEAFKGQNKSAGIASRHSRRFLRMKSCASRGKKAVMVFQTSDDESDSDPPLAILAGVVEDRIDLA